jgi:hypothetical protein
MRRPPRTTAEAVSTAKESQCSYTRCIVLESMFHVVLTGGEKLRWMLVAAILCAED